MIVEAVRNWERAKRSRLEGEILTHDMEDPHIATFNESNCNITMHYPLHSVPSHSSGICIQENGVEYAFNTNRKERVTRQKGSQKWGWL